MAERGAAAFDAAVRAWAAACDDLRLVSRRARQPEFFARGAFDSLRLARESVPPPRIAQEAGVTAARAAAESPKGAISVAVLPFLNLSSDKEQEFFSDGMTEEITAALAKVPDLRVVARTSAFEFKGKNVEIEKIGEQLHLWHMHMRWQDASLMRPMRFSWFHQPSLRVIPNCAIARPN